MILAISVHCVLDRTGAKIVFREGREARAFDRPDTEGPEFAGLNSFDFSSHKIRLITCEHNFGPQRDRIHTLLAGYGYRRVYESLSQFDDWYVLQ